MIRLFACLSYANTDNWWEFCSSKARAYMRGNELMRKKSNRDLCVILLELIKSCKSSGGNI